jgi:hypothetical protein
LRFIADMYGQMIRSFSENVNHFSENVKLLSGAYAA